MKQLIALSSAAVIAVTLSGCLTDKPAKPATITKPAKVVKPAKVAEPVKKTAKKIAKPAKAKPAVASKAYAVAWSKGLKEYKAKKYKEALVSLSQAVKLAKTPGEKFNSMYYQAHALHYSKKTSDAAKVFGDILKVDKLTVTQKNSAFNMYLHCVYWSRKYKEVLDIAKKTTADAKASNYMKTISAYLGTLASYNLKKYAESETWAKKLAELNPKGVWHSRGLIYQARALSSQKKHKAGLALLSKDAIAKMHPHRQGEAYMERGEIQRRQKQYPAAVIEYTAVYEIPKGSYTHKEIVIVKAIESLNAAGKPEAAAVWIDRIGSIKSKYWRTLGLLRTAQMLQKQGKLEEAKKKWTECKKSGPWWIKLADQQIAVINKKLKK